MTLNRISPTLIQYLNRKISIYSTNCNENEINIISDFAILYNSSPLLLLVLFIYLLSVNCSTHMILFYDIFKLTINTHTLYLLHRSFLIVNILKCINYTFYNTNSN